MAEHPLLDDAIALVKERGMASTPMLMVHFSIGFLEAYGLMDDIAETGILEPKNGPRPRKVIFSKEPDNA